MTKRSKKQKQAGLIRISRRIHRQIAPFLFIFFLFISITGLLLGWKNFSNGNILPSSYQGTTNNLENWLPIYDLNKIADQILQDSVSSNLSLKLDRIDIRKEMGMVKFIYQDHYWGIQLDGATGDLLHIGKRKSDFIENIHDGSIIDRYLGSEINIIKLIYTSILGITLLTFTITGFWLWYGPKKMNNHKKTNKH